MSYTVNEVFYSIQGEGLRVGTTNVFVRFSGCNLKCNQADDGFDCDTEFSSGVKYELPELVDEIAKVGGECRAVIFTGGEPGLQVDEALCDQLIVAGYYLAIETNGTQSLPVDSLDWITVSPKTAEHTLRVERVEELKYVRFSGQGIPKLLLQR